MSTKTKLINNNQLINTFNKYVEECKAKDKELLKHYLLGITYEFI